MLARQRTITFWLIQSKVYADCNDSVMTVVGRQQGAAWKEHKSGAMKWVVAIKFPLQCAQIVSNCTVNSFDHNSKGITPTQINLIRNLLSFICDMTH